MNKDELRKSGKLKKVIIFDCDNTLWKGVVGEDIIEPNIDIQKDAKFLANRGVIIGLCSKNNEDDINEVLKNQILTDEYISIKRINWNNKVLNLQEIAEELNIGLDSIVFVDDSPFEINYILEQLPEILAIYPNELMETVHMWFDLTGSLGKTREYKEQYLRKKESNLFLNIDDYLKSLNMIIKIRLNDKKNIARISELTQKTNQFNLTTRRYDDNEINEFMTNNSVYTLSISDKFGDNGITGVCIVRTNVIDLFLLSCRILGRGIEYAFIDCIVNDLKNMKYEYVFAEYISTPKNKQVESFYSKIGFVRENDSSIYKIKISDYIPLGAKYFKYE